MALTTICKQEWVFYRGIHMLENQRVEALKIDAQGELSIDVLQERLDEIFPNWPKYREGNKRLFNEFMDRPIIRLFRGVK